MKRTYLIVTAIILLAAAGVWAVPFNGGQNQDEMIESIVDMVDTLKSTGMRNDMEYLLC